MASEFVKGKVASNKVVMFSKSHCPYCKMAKSALASVGLKDYVLIELDERDDGSAIQDALQKITGARTVPRVFIGGKFVGGGSEMKEFQSSGKLKPMLEKAGAL